MCIVFAKEAREGQNAEDKAERLMAATGHHLEDVIALLRQRNTSTLCWPLEVCESLNTQDRAELATCHQVASHVIHLVVLPKIFAALPSAEKHMCLVLALQARQGPNTQDKAERLMATTGHLFEEMMATYHSLGVAGKVETTRQLPLQRRRPHLALSSPFQMLIPHRVWDASTITAQSECCLRRARTPHCTVA